MKYLIKIAFIGDNFNGFQVQRNKRTVQGELTLIFCELFGVKTMITGCSRTDSGVHANAFYITAEPDVGANLIPPDKIPKAVANLLPSDISVISACAVDSSFHPRYNVKSKEYIYKIYVGEPNPFIYHRAYTPTYNITDYMVKLMNEGAKYIIGKHDFTSFMAAGSKITDAIREVYSLDISKNDDIINIKISADGFLYNMVRIIVGTLLSVAKGEIKKEDIPVIIAAKNRKMAPRTAPPYGLYLNSVTFNYIISKN